MNKKLRQDAEQIVRAAIEAVKPDQAVQRALADWTCEGKLYLVAAGKAAWQMADAAVRCLAKKPEAGIVVTKYHHVVREIPGITCYEAGHPVPDDNSFQATQAVLNLTEHLTAEDTVLFLLSGGGSALFEKPLVSGGELQDITHQLLACGADIVEINTIRKRLSAVKGGRFAAWCAPARVKAVILSDILGDPLDMIASGPTVPDQTTCADAEAIVKKYQLSLSEKAWSLIHQETPKTLDNSEQLVIGSVRELCKAAANVCEQLGYEPTLLTDHLNCEARDAGRFLAAIARTHQGDGKPMAFLAGGETVVHLTGKGLGGRNQELALAACEGLNCLHGTAVISAGSDGTDGPTDAAGGYSDGDTFEELKQNGMKLDEVLADNDAYHALKAVNGLIITGPTGTNVNDISLVLINPSLV